jgi:hypothetical protein
MTSDERKREEILQFLLRWNEEQERNRVRPESMPDDPCPVCRAINFFPPIRLH